MIDIPNLIWHQGTPTTDMAKWTLESYKFDCDWLA